MQIFQFPLPYKAPTLTGARVHFCSICVHNFKSEPIWYESNSSFELSGDRSQAAYMYLGSSARGDARGPQRFRVPPVCISRNQSTVRKPLWTSFVDDYIDPNGDAHYKSRTKPSDLDFDVL